MKDIKVTVITVCYNSAYCIEKTIKSVISQTYPNIEYIIIDGGSKDNTLEIIEKYKNNISYYFSEPDNGIYDAMNKGILKASGVLLNFMNSGDTFTNSSIIEEVLDHYSGEAIIHGNIIRCFNHYKERVKACTSNNPNIMDFIFKSFPHQASFIKLNLFKKYGLYSTEYKLISDWKFFFDCVILNHVSSKYINTDIAYFQMDGASSKYTDYYLEERKSYLKIIYGNEIYTYLEELDSYRSTRLIKNIYEFKLTIKRAIGLKRLIKIKSFFHLLIK